MLRLFSRFVFGDRCHYENDTEFIEPRAEGFMEKFQIRTCTLEGEFDVEIDIEWWLVQGLEVLDMGRRP